MTDALFDSIFDRVMIEMEDRKMRKECNVEGMVYWLSWLRQRAIEKGIWTGKNDDIIYQQIQGIIEKTNNE